MANPKGNPDNLVTKEKRTPNERRKAASKAGKASGASRRRKKAMKDLVIEMLSLDLTEEFEETLKTQAPMVLGKKKLTAEDAMIFGQMVKAMQGDTRAAAFIRDTAGETPVEKVEVSAGVESAAESIAAAVAKRKAREDG